MKSFLLFTHTGPMLILSRFDSIQQPELLNQLAGYGKFIAHEIPVEVIKACYEAHYEHVLRDPKQTDDLRVLDDDGESIFTNISFQELGPPVYFEPGKGIRYSAGLN